MNCFRYLGFTSFAEVDRLTIPEYELLMEAERLKQVDADYRNHLQAFLNFAVKATKGSGKRAKPKYSSFDKFFDYDKEIKKAKKEKKQSSRFAGIGQFFKKGG